MARYFVVSDGIENGKEKQLKFPVRKFAKEHAMTIKDQAQKYIAKSKKLLKKIKTRFQEDYSQPIDPNGLIDLPISPTTNAASEKDGVIAKTRPQTADANSNESIEKLQTGFSNLIDQLQQINGNLNQQGQHSHNLIEKLSQLPNILESLPSVVDNQKNLTEQMLQNLQSSDLRNQQFVDFVEQIPTETAKQTDALTSIEHQLAAGANTDAQLVSHFQQFNEIIDKLNQTCSSQTDSIMQMSKTFAASDRYLKYIISKQNRIFRWIFVGAISVCVVVILLFASIIIYLKS